ncbi:hypothetical protein SteCoe_4054 [Stentor coeruleus]|uniref:Uncharacterized protein n=1 Tax=Stentor coeruleus TaxID=5963 RepID=A0A1R2CVS2_9CILI|nr:hypothetical protein SteCoe_4054 [Stentor coeruleus]
MGNCNCLDSHPDTPEALLSAATNSDSPASIAYKLYEKTMLPELKHIYTQFLLRKSETILILDIRDKELGDGGAELISKILPELTNLAELVLINNQLGISGVSKISDNTANLTKLERLIITNNHIKDEGFEYLSQTMPYMKNLREINISYNDLTPIGLDHLLEPLNTLEKVETLNISGNEINKKCLRKIALALQNMSTIKFFKFDEGNMKSSDIGEIKEMLPRVFRKDTSN